LDRLAAIERVRAFLAKDGPRKARRWYDASVVADDLPRYVRVLDRADDDYVELFLERVNALLGGADRRIYRPLPAIERLMWHFVRRRLKAELLEVVRFEKAGGARRKKRIGLRAYGDYPFLDDPAADIPRSVFRLETAARRARHVGALVRPYVTPRRPGRRR
jgi:CDP-glycerol glycerophosphotransferase